MLSCAQAQFGEHLKLAGSCGELGGWDLDKAKSMQWTDGDYWVADLCLPAQEPINFKLVHVATNGQHWEPGDSKSALALCQYPYLYS